MSTQLYLEHSSRAEPSQQNPSSSIQSPAGVTKSKEDLDLTDPRTKVELHCFSCCRTVRVPGTVNRCSACTGLLSAYPLGLQKTVVEYVRDYSQSLKWRYWPLARREPLDDDFGQNSPPFDHLQEEAQYWDNGGKSPSPLSALAKLIRRTIPGMKRKTSRLRQEAGKNTLERGKRYDPDSRLLERYPSDTRMDLPAGGLLRLKNAREHSE